MTPWFLAEGGKATSKDSKNAVDSAEVSPLPNVEVALLLEHFSFISSNKAKQLRQSTPIVITKTTVSGPAKPANGKATLIIDAKSFF